MDSNKQKISFLILETREIILFSVYVLQFFLYRIGFLLSLWTVFCPQYNSGYLRNSYHGCSENWLIRRRELKTLSSKWLYYLNFTPTMKAFFNLNYQGQFQEGCKHPPGHFRGVPAIVCVHSQLIEFLKKLDIFNVKFWSRCC